MGFHSVAFNARPNHGANLHKTKAFYRSEARVCFDCVRRLIPDGKMMQIAMNHLTECATAWFTAQPWTKESGGQFVLIPKALFISHEAARARGDEILIYLPNSRAIPDYLFSARSLLTNDISSLSAGLCFETLFYYKI